MLHTYQDNAVTKYCDPRTYATLFADTFYCYQSSCMEQSSTFVANTEPQLQSLQGHALFN